MSAKRTNRVIGVAAVLGAYCLTAWWGCSVTIDTGGGDGDPSLTFTIGGTEITIGLGLAGIFDLAPGIEQTNIADIAPLEQPPDDQPSSAAVRLRSTSVSVLPPQNAKRAVNAAENIGFDVTTQTGVVDVSIFLDVAGTANPCETGVRVGSFDIEVVNGVATGVHKVFDDKYETSAVPLRYLRVFHENNLSMCLKARSPFAGRVRVDGVVVTFGPSVQVGFELPDPRDPAETTEACCRPPVARYSEWGEPYEQLCENIPNGISSAADICQWSGGVPQGPGSRCADSTCRADFRACCHINVDADYNHCYEATHAYCTQDESSQHPDVPHAAGTHCNSDPRPCDRPARPPQACCLSDGGCDDEPLSDGRCPNGGTSKGEGTTCATVSCAAPDATRACCFAGRPCEDLVPTACDLADGTPQGPGSRCSTTSCPQSSGACCLSGGTCETRTQAACLASAGTYQGNGTICAPNPCPQTAPTGACCVTGSCNDLTAEECAALPGGVYSGDGVACATVECTPPVEYVLWYTGNVSCWSAPLMYISTRDNFNQPDFAANYPGGGIDYTISLQKVELQGGFATVEEARAWICPQFETFFYHNWCSPHYLARGQWWLPGGLGCDLSGVPQFVPP